MIINLDFIINHYRLSLCVCMCVCVCVSDLRRIEKELSYLKFYADSMLNLR